MQPTWTFFCRNSRNKKNASGLQSFNFFNQIFAKQKQTASTEGPKFHLWVTHVNFINQLKVFKMFFQEPTKVFEVKFHIKFVCWSELTGPWNYMNECNQLERFLQKFAKQKNHKTTEVPKFHLCVTHVNFTNQLKVFKMSFQQPSKVFKVKFHINFVWWRELTGPWYKAKKKK